MHRIVLFYPDVLGGVRTYVTNLATWFHENNVSYLVICYGNGRGFSTVKKDGALPKEILLRFSPYATEASKYRDLVSELKEDDILICNDSFELEAISNEKLKNRTAFILHGDLTHYYNTLLKHAQVIDHVFCVSKGLKEKYGNLFPTLPFSIAYTLIQNFHPTIRDNRSSLKIVFIGRFEKMKGADDFVKVIKTINARTLEVQWYVYTTEAGSDKTILAQLPLNTNTAVFFDTPNSQLLLALEDMDILVFPSRSEGLGLAVLEAMKRGVVPVARNIPIGIPDMVQDNKTGFLVNSAEEIVSVIELLYNDRALLKKIKHNANDYANSHFDLQKSANNFIQLANSIVEKEKKFEFRKQQSLERIMPERLYRVCKFLFYLTKYRRLAC